MTQAPPASETRKQLEANGIPTDEIEEAIKEYRDKMGQAVKSDDFLVWLVAKKKFGVNVPSISTLESGGGDKLIKMGEVQSRASEDAYYRTKGYVLDSYEYQPEGKNSRRKIVLLDDTGVGTIMVWHNNLDAWDREGVDVGDYVEISGLQALRISEDFIPLTFGSYSEVSTPTEPSFSLDECYDALPDASEEHVGEWDYAFIFGAVSDEQRHQFEQGDGMQTRMGEFHTLSVKAGGALLTVKLPPNLAPHKDLFGHPVKIVAQWRPETYEVDGTEKTTHIYRAVSIDIGGQEFDTLRNELEAQANAAEAQLTDSDPTVDNVFDYVVEHGGDEGVKVKDLVDAFGGAEMAVDEAVDSLLDSGRLCEPEFGVVRVTG